MIKITMSASVGEYFVNRRLYPKRLEILHGGLPVLLLVAHKQKAYVHLNERSMRIIQPALYPFSLFASTIRSFT